jgi:subtilisin family serine protease
VSRHPDLGLNVAEGVALIDCEGDCAEPWADDAGHGTACAGVIGATGEGDAIVGVAPRATLLPATVLDASNAGRVSLVVEGLRWAVRRDCDVVNMSISGAAS